MLRKEKEKMTDHDKAILRIAKDLLRKGAKSLLVGKCVVSRKKIVSQLKEDFPKRKVGIGGDIDIET